MALAAAEGLVASIRDACKKGNAEEANKLLTQFKVRISSSNLMPSCVYPWRDS